MRKVADQEGARARLGQVIESFGMTVAGFAAEIGMSRAGLGQALSGKNAISPQLIHSVSVTFGIDEDWLLTGEGDPSTFATKEDEPGEELASRRRDALHLLIKSLSEEDLDTLFRLAEKLVGINRDVTRLYDLRRELDDIQKKA